MLAIEKLLTSTTQTTAYRRGRGLAGHPAGGGAGGIPITSATPHVEMKAVNALRRGRCRKKQVQEMSASRCIYRALCLPDDTADALAMAITSAIPTATS